MKKSVKFIVGGIMVCVGVLLIGIAAFLDGWKVFSEIPSIYIDADGIYFSDAYNGESEVYTLPLESGAKDIKIDTGAGRVKIFTDDVSEIQVKATGIMKRCSVEYDGSSYSIEAGKGFTLFSFLNNSQITITIPKSLTVENVNIDSGAGELVISSVNIGGEFNVNSGAGSVNINSVRCQNLKVDTGTGQVEIKNIDVSDTLEISSGTGSLEISDASCTSLSLDSGVGSVNFSGEVYGDISLDTGTGSVNMELCAKKSDYRFTVDKGIGSVTVNGNSISSGGSGKHSFDINSGIGSVEISFSEE